MLRKKKRKEDPKSSKDKRPVVQYSQGFYITFY